MKYSDLKSDEDILIHYCGMKQNQFTFFHVFTIITLISLVSNWSCGVDKIEGLKNQKIPVSSHGGDQRRFLADSKYSPIRIQVDYSNIEKNTSLSQSWISNVKLIVNQSLDLFRSILLVKPNVGKLKIPSCVNQKIEYTTTDYSNVGVDADILIFVTKDPTESSVEAWASACLLSAANFRPIAGVIGLTDKLIFDQQNWLINFTYLLLHELTHVFVMQTSLFENFWDETKSNVRDFSEVLATNIMINGVARSMIKTPKVLEAAAKHFGCSTITGVELENQGGTGSAGAHWEARVMLGDYMIASSYEDIFISEITLALFEDSGWYTTNKYTGGLFKFGKNEGCGFLDKKCITNEQSSFPQYYCTVNKEARCYAGGKYKGFCQISATTNTDPNYYYFSDKSLGGYSISDYCPVARSYYDANYYYGGHCAIGKAGNYPTVFKENISISSGCFISSLYDVNSTSTYSSTISICYSYQCDSNLKSVVIKIDGTSVNCPTAGGTMTVAGYKGQITCPKYDNYCTSSVQCYDIKDCIDKKSTLIPDPNAIVVSTNSPLNAAHLGAKLYTLICLAIIFLN